VLGFGTVTGPYEFVSEDHEYRHRRPVDWDDVQPRKVEEGGWRRTLVSLDRDKFEKLRDAPIIANGEPPIRLTARAFELLEGLFQEPTGDHYAARKDEFQRWLETPFRDLMAQIIGRLPTEVTERMETEKNLFGRIRKNDYGRGGAWPFYWGALYPKGNRRTEAAQLILSIKPDRLEAGFDMGEHDDSARERFLTQAAHHRNRLARMLGPVLERPDLVFGDRDQHEDEQGHLRAEETPTWSEWLNAPRDYGIDVVRVFPRSEVVRRPTEELAEEIAQVFSELFPLVLLSLSDNPLPEIRRHVADPDVDDIEPEINQPYPLADCAAKLKMDSDTIGRWVRTIHRKGQAILYGPPGTGKTYAAEHLADHLIGGGDGFRELVQFHPSYAYEDFIQGIRPAARSGGGLDYPVKPGRFLEFCERAGQRTGTCVLIVDEINRANLSRVFGELMYLLENRGEAVPLAAGGERFSIPANVRILGTMNTADRSIALVDHALRRRFAFLALAPDHGTLRRYHEETDYDPEPLISLLREVNEAIGDPYYEVGITYFLLEDLADQIEDVWSLEIVPYLEEYFADRPEVVRQFEWKEVRERLSG
jgi:5-methylcytosine-specific restriction enzyme B